MPFNGQLNPSPFSFEVIIEPASALDPTFPYCLAESTGPPGPQGLDPKKTGWGLYLGPSDLNNPNPAGPLLWQVWMGDGTQFQRVAIAKPGFPQRSDGTVIPQSSKTVSVPDLRRAAKLAAIPVLPRSRSGPYLRQSSGPGDPPAFLRFYPEYEFSSRAGRFFYRHRQHLVSDLRSSPSTSLSLQGKNTGGRAL